MQCWFKKRDRVQDFNETPVKTRFTFVVGNITSINAVVPWNDPPNPKSSKGSLSSKG